MTDYSLWEVIFIGDSPIPTRVIEGVVQPVASTTTKQRLARKDELKARGTLLLALLDKHQLKFNIYKDAKTLIEAIEKRFGGNKETKKVQKTLLKQQYENFTGSSSKSLDQIHDRLQKLISQLEILRESLLKIYEAEVKSSSSASTSTQNIAFVSSQNTDNTNEPVSAVTSVSAASVKIPVSPLPNVDTLSNVVIYSFFASQFNSPQLDNDDLKQIDADDPEEMDLKWQMAMLTVRERQFLQRTGRNLGANEPTLMGFDMLKVECYNCQRKWHFARECSVCNYDWSFQAEEEPTNYALMAFTPSSSSSFDNKVASCSKACTKAYATLQSHYDKLNNDLRKSQFDVISYKTRLEYVKARILVYQQNKTVFEEDIKLLKLDVQLRDNALVVLRQKFEKAEQERDELKLKLEKFQTSSKNLSQLLASQTNDKTELGYDTQVFTSFMFDCDEMFSSETDDSLPASLIYDRYQSRERYHAVPPPYTGTFMPPKPDLVFHDAPNVNKTVHTAFNVEFSPTKPKKYLSHTYRPSLPIIEDWVSDSEDDYETEPSQNDLSFVQPTEQVKTPRPSVKTDVHPIPTPKTAIRKPRTHSNSRNRKACFVYKSLTHLIKDLLTKFKLVPLTAARPVTTAVPQPLVAIQRPAKTVITKPHSPPRRTINRRPSPAASNFPPKVTTLKAPKVNAVKEQSTNPHHALKDKGVIDSGCSRHMTGNISYLTDIKEINGGYVAFGGNPKGGKISDTECIVLSPEFKLPDENQVLLRVPRENNMYNVDLKNIVPSGDLTCLFAKATLDKFNLWHRRLAYINFKIMNKLAKEVNTACYVQNRVLVTKLHNKTPYKLLLGRTPSIGFMRPFGCPMTILNTLDPLGKFDRKTDEGFLVRYSVSSSGPTWLFDIDTLTKSMNYQPVTAGNQSNPSACVQEQFDAEKAREEHVQQYVLFPLWSSGSKDPQNTDGDATFEVKEHEFEGRKPESEVYISPSSSAKTKKHNDKTKREAKGKSPVDTPVPTIGQISTNNINNLSAAGPFNTAVSPKLRESSYVDHSQYPDDPNMPALEDITYSDDEEDVGAEADFSNLEITITVSPILTTRVHKDHHKPDGIFISQDKYVAEILRKFGLTDGKSASTDASEGFNQIIDFLNASSIKYVLTINPNIYVSCIKQSWSSISVKKVNYVVRLQALIDRKKVIITEATIREALRLDDAERVDCLPNEEIFTELSRTGYEKPSTKLTFYKAFLLAQWKFLIHTILQFMSAKRTSWNEFSSSMASAVICLSTVDEKVRIEVFVVDLKVSAVRLIVTAFMSAKRTSWNEFSSSMASAVICLSTGRKFIFSKYIFDSLVRNVDSSSKFYMYPRFLKLMIRAQFGDLSSYTTKYSSPVLTQKVFANMRRVGKGFFRLETPLFKGMSVPQQAAADVDNVVNDDVAADDLLNHHHLHNNNNLQNLPLSQWIFYKVYRKLVLALTRRVKNLEQDKIAQVKIIQLKKRVRKLEKKKKLRVSGGGIIAKINANEDVTLKDVAAVDKEVEVKKDAYVQRRLEESQAQIYKIDLKHADKVLSMQDDVEEPAELQEVIEVVTTAKLMTEVVTAATTTITAAAHITAATITTVPTAARRRKGVVIRDPKETATPSTIIHSEPKSKDKGNEILTEAQARKNMIVYLKNMAGFKMDYFKGMSYDDISLIFEKYFNSNVAFLEKSKEQLEEEASRALKRTSESQEEKPVKKQKLDEEIPVVDYAIYTENNKPFYKIIRADGSHQLFLSFLSLLRNFDREDLEMLWQIVQERFASSKPKNFFDDFLLTILTYMFEKPDVKAQVWKNQRSVHGLAKVKSWRLLESYGVHIITFTTTQMILLVERKYPLTRFTLDQMLNHVKLEVEKEKNIIAAGSANRPLMLEKGMYDSWKTQILLYIRGKKNGKMLIDSIEKDPYKLAKEIIVKGDDGLTDITREQTPGDLAPKDRLRYDSDFKAVNINLLGLLT
nr:hypothetical protein [Tanacetum cinerariifolium]